jgi:hypothetical protein
METMTEPMNWKFAHFANVGTGEAFVQQILEVEEVLQGTLIVGQAREQAKNAIMTIMTDGLIPAFQELRMIRAPETANLPLTERFQPYEDFARKLWKAYKDLTQRAATAMGFDIGFLYQKDKEFEKGLSSLLAVETKLPATFADFLRQTRSDWQNEFSKFRNEFVEHQHGQRMDFKKFYDSGVVERLFESVWGTIVDLLVVLMSTRVPPGIQIALNDPNVHGPWPKRFRWVAEGLRQST